MMTFQQNDASVKNTIIQNIKRRDIILQKKFTLCPKLLTEKLNDTQFPHVIGLYVGLFAEICPVVCLSCAHVVASVINKRQCCQGPEGVALTVRPAHAA